MFRRRLCAPRAQLNVDWCYDYDFHDCLDHGGSWFSLMKIDRDVEGKLVWLNERTREVEKRVTKLEH